MGRGGGRRHVSPWSTNHAPWKELSGSMATEPEHAATELIEGFERLDRVRRRQVAPSDGDANAGVRFIERPSGALEAKPSVARLGAEAFREIQGDARQSPPDLRCEIAVSPADRNDQWTRKLDDVEDLFQDLLPAGGEVRVSAASGGDAEPPNQRDVHASTRAASVTPASDPRRALCPVARKVRAQAGTAPCGSCRSSTCDCGSHRCRSCSCCCYRKLLRPLPTEASPRFDGEAVLVPLTKRGADKWVAFDRPVKRRRARADR